MSAFALRFYWDTLGPEARAVVLPAGVRTVYARSGAVTLDGIEIAEDEAWFGDGQSSLEGAGATLWRCEFAPLAEGPILPAGLESELILEAELTTLSPQQGLMMRCDSVAFPPGGCAYTHTHKGPGIRCMRDGAIRIDSDGHSTHFAPGEPWFESGPVPVFAQADPAQDSRFIRVSILPRSLEGKSSITYVLPEDQDKPKLQTYRGYFDRFFDI